MFRYLIIGLTLIFCSAALMAGYSINTDIPADSAYIDSVVQLTHDRLTRIYDRIPDDTLEIYMVTSEEKFDQVAAGNVPDWGAAVAIPYRKKIVIKSPLILPGDKSLGELVAHEYAHIALARRVGYRTVPRWLNEGLSMYVSAEWGWNDNLSIGIAVITGATVPLPDIERLNSFSQDRAATAYSQSYLAVVYFLETYGESSLRLILDNIRDGKDIDYAFITAIGTDCEDFEREFNIYLSGRYNLIAVIFNSNILWLMLAVIVIVGFLMHRLRRRKRFEDMDRYDQLHSTDFDYGAGVEKPDEDKPWD